MAFDLGNPLASPSSVDSASWDLAEFVVLLEGSCCLWRSSALTSFSEFWADCCHVGPNAHFAVATFDCLASDSHTAPDRSASSGSFSLHGHMSGR